jgi:hypothetical protein
MKNETAGAAAEAGHNSRHFDVERTALEIRAKFIQENAKDNTSLKWRLLVRAWASPMSDRDFRQLTGHVISSRADGSRAERSHPTMAILSGCSIRASQKSDANLKAGGWILSERRQRDSVSRTVRIPPANAEAIDLVSFDILEPQSDTVQEGLEPHSNAVQAKFENLEPHHTVFRTAPQCGQTYNRTYEENIYAQPASCACNDEASHVNGEHLNGHPASLCDLLAESEEPARAAALEKKDPGPKFEEFWEAYPNKKGKVDAQKFWKRLPAEDRRAAIDAVPRYLKTVSDLNYARYGSTYLSKRTWEDDLSAAAGGKAKRELAAFRPRPVYGRPGR